MFGAPSAATLLLLLGQCCGPIAPVFPQDSLAWAPGWTGTCCRGAGCCTRCWAHWCAACYCTCCWNFRLHAAAGLAAAAAGRLNLATVQVQSLACVRVLTPTFLRGASKGHIRVPAVAAAAAAVVAAGAAGAGAGMSAGAAAAAGGGIVAVSAAAFGCHGYVVRHGHGADAGAVPVLVSVPVPVPGAPAQLHGVLH